MCRLHGETTNPQVMGTLGALDADLGFRISVMAAAGMLRQGCWRAEEGHEVKVGGRKVVKRSEAS